LGHDAFFMASIFQKGIATIKDLMMKLSGQKPKEIKKNPLEEVFKNVNGNPFSCIGSMNLF